MQNHEKLWAKEDDQFNPSSVNHGRREKIKLNFYFQTSLWCLKEM